MIKITVPLMLLIQVFSLSGCGDDPETPSADERTADPAVLNSAQALDKKYGIAAGIRCGSDSDDYLRTVAKYSFKWDDLGAMDFKFDRFLKDVAGPGILMEVSDKVTLQNGFGAYERIHLYCAYDTQNKKILAYAVDSPPVLGAISP